MFVEWSSLYQTWGTSFLFRMSLAKWFSIASWTKPNLLGSMGKKGCDIEDPTRQIERTNL